MKKIVQKALSLAGYRLAKLNKAEHSASAPTPYQAGLLSLMAGSGRLRIVQVGANDGALNDPLYPVVFKYPQRTDVLLIEPQIHLLPFLKSNYAFHPRPVIHNGAIGPSGELILYAIKPEAWKMLDVPPYAKDWPSYRAPTGVTSTKREHVSGWLQKHYRGKAPGEEMIEELHVPSSPLMPLLERYGWETQVDVLQIDAEGFDDEVIYACSVADTRPKLINFERRSLGPERYRSLSRHLVDEGYVISVHGNDALAIRVNGT